LRTTNLRSAQLTRAVPPSEAGVWTLCTYIPALIVSKSYACQKLIGSPIRFFTAPGTGVASICGSDC
jgi:hypothetical protein